MRRQSLHEIMNAEIKYQLRQWSFFAMYQFCDDLHIFIYINIIITLFHKRLSAHMHI